jgi:cytoskeletal protein CcmA (bactofilin family)
VEGSLGCKNADIEGQVKGKLTVSDTLSLRASAHVDGDVQTGKLAVEPGATFNAHCQMKGSVKELKTDNKPITSASAKPEQSA